jgi:hypothetical protein
LLHDRSREILFIDGLVDIRHYIIPPFARFWHAATIAGFGILLQLFFLPAAAFGAAAFFAFAMISNIFLKPLAWLKTTAE